MKFKVLLLLSLISKGQGRHKCNIPNMAEEVRLTNCGPFEVLKTEDHYMLRARQCTSGNNCNIDQNFLECNDVCKISEMLNSNGKQ